MSDEKRDIFEDFAGGLNTRTAPNRILASQTPTATNVWFDARSLGKRTGVTQNGTGAMTPGSSLDAYRARQIHAFANYSAAPPVDALVMIGRSDWTGAVARDILIYTLDNSTFSTMAYSASAVTIPGTYASTAASPTITGTSTSFLLLAVGDVILAGGTLTTIASIASDTSLTMTANAASTQSGSTAAVMPSWPANTIVSFAEMNSLLWICGQGRVSVSWSGTLLVNRSAFPAASFSLVYRNYMFAANTAANPSRISWSTIKDPTTWGASNFVDVAPDNGQPIVGLFYDGSSIVILKTASAFRLTGDVFDPANPTYTLTQIATPSDFLINTSKSVQLMNGMFIMLGQRGLYGYNGNEIILLEFSTDNKDQFLANLNFAIGQNQTANATPRSIIVDGNYWVSTESSTFSHTSGNKNVVFCLDKNNKLWRWNMAANAQISDMAYRAGTLYAVNYDTVGQGIYTLNTGTVDTGTTAINGTWTSKVFEYANQQRFGQVFVYFKKQAAGNLTFEVSVDEGSFVSNTIDMTAGTGTRVKSEPIIVGRVGRSIQFRVSNNVASQTFELYGIELNRKELRR